MNIHNLLSAKPVVVVAGLSASALFSVLPVISAAETTGSLNECMLQRIDVENDDVTLGQLREKCLSAETDQPDEDEPGAVTSRLRADDINVLRP